MAEKRRLPNADSMGLTPGISPVALGAGIPLRAEDHNQPLASVGAPIPGNEAELRVAHPEGGVAPVQQVKVNTMDPETARKAKVDALMERLVTGRTRPAQVAPGPKTHHLTIALPVPVHAALEKAAGERQIPALIRESMLRLASEAQFRFSVAFKTTLAQSYEAFVQVRRASRRGEGTRTVTIPMTSEERNQLIALAKQFGLGPIPLLEVLAFEMVQGEFETK